MIETLTPTETAIGFDKMMNATVNFRAVLTMGGARPRCLVPGLGYSRAKFRSVRSQT
jgi:hypothetical protein